MFSVVAILLQHYLEFPPTSFGLLHPPDHPVKFDTDRLLMFECPRACPCSKQCSLEIFERRHSGVVTEVSQVRLHP